MNKRIAIVVSLAGTFALSACGDYRTSDQIQYQQQEVMLKQAAMSLGMPAITNFAEKRMMKDILELRDKNVTTYTYLVGVNNQLTKLCDSVGYGLPYATQYTSPNQADPNGLYSPASAEGTWVACKVPGKDKISPTYIEPRIIVSTFPLDSIK